VSRSQHLSSAYLVALFSGTVTNERRFAAAFRSRLPWLRRQSRRARLVLWWTLTLQLHVHARYWLRARRLRRQGIEQPANPLLPWIDPATLVVPFAETPEVSVIVPTYGQLDYTLSCLASIAQHVPEAAIEVLVIDDAYPHPPPRHGEPPTPLHAVRGIRLIRNDTNLGYLRSCNAAAGQARGRHLYLLNNDTQVLPGWLDPMLTLLRARADAGMVGAKLLFPDGSLQEAGGIIWRDASGWNFGRHEDPTHPVYNYVREVDYCSGAALLIERALFQRMGGFDERYAPAYFEDSDLSFRLRQIGLKTLYQPASRVVHFEGASHGRDETVGIKACQVVNRRRFIDAWEPALAADHFQSGQHVLRARDRARHRQVVLVVDHLVPEPDRDAGSRTIEGFLRAMLDDGMVVKFWPHNQCYSPGYTERLQQMGIEVLFGPSVKGFEEWMCTNGAEIDTVLINRPDVAEDVLPAARRYCSGPIVYYGHDLHFRRMRRQAELTGDDRLARAAARMEERECRLWRQFDLSLYPSSEEADIARAMQPDARFRAVIPYGFATFDARDEPPPGDEIVFVGGFAHPPNEDAAAWFVEQVLPLVHQQAPTAHLSIIGSNPTETVRALAEHPRVTVRANVSADALRAAYDRARVATVPLRCGAGVKLKVVEALQAGLPLVTTPVGAQGLSGLWSIAAVETDPAAFAAAVVALLRDDDAWRRQSAAQLAYVAERFSTKAMADSLLSALRLAREQPQQRAA